MTIGEFKDLAAGLQSVLVSFGVFIAGAWAIYRFQALRDRDRAVVELERLKRQLDERGTLNIELTTTQSTQSVSSQRVLQVSAKIANAGQRTEVIHWSPDAIRLSRVTNEPNGKSKVTFMRGEDLLSSAGRISSSIEPGQSSIYPFCVYVEEPGVYLLEFRVIGSPQQTSAAASDHTAAGAKIADMAWGAACTVHVV